MDSCFSEKTTTLARMRIYLKKVEQRKQADFCLDCLKIVMNASKHDLRT